MSDDNKYKTFDDMMNNMSQHDILHAINAYEKIRVDRTKYSKNYRTSINDKLSQLERLKTLCDKRGVKYE